MSSSGTTQQSDSRAMKKLTYITALGLSLAGQANAQQVSAFPQATVPLSGSELVYLVQSGNGKQTTVGNLISGGLIGNFASPPPIGNVTPNTGAFTALTASGTVSGAGFIARFASPGPIGSTSASTGAFTTLSASLQANFLKPAGVGINVTAGAVIGTQVTVPNLGSASGTDLIVSPGGNTRTITFGDPNYGIGVMGTMTMGIGASAASMVWNGNFQSRVINTGTSTLTLSGSTNQPVAFFNSNYTGTSTFGNPSLMVVSHSRAAVNASGTQNGWFTATIGGNIGDGGGLTGTAGGQAGLLVAINQDGPVASGGSSVFLGALNAWFSGNAAITGGSNGNAVVFNPQLILGAAGSGYSLAEMIEGTLQASMSVNTLGTRGWLTMFSGGTNQAPIDDYAIGIFKDVAASDVPFKIGMTFSRNNGPWGIDTTGSLINASVQRNGGPGNGWVNQVAAYGVNLPTVNFGTAALWFPGFQVTGDGTTRVGAGAVTPIATGMSIDVVNYSGGSPTISNAGAAYVANDQLYDTNGGILNVDTVNGSGNITAFHYLRTPYSYGGAGAATMALKGGSGNQAAVVGVTWTQQTALAIQPTAGGKLGFYGATPIVKATPVGACAGNTGCQALRDALGNLGFINTGSISN